MKITKTINKKENPEELIHILVKAYSEEAVVDFAVIAMSQKWFEQQKKRFDLIEKIKENEKDNDFISLKYKTNLAFPYFYDIWELEDEDNEDKILNMAELFRKSVTEKDFTFAFLEDLSDEELEILIEYSLRTGRQTMTICMNYVYFEAVDSREEILKTEDIDFEKLIKSVNF